MAAFLAPLYHLSKAFAIAPSGQHEGIHHAATVGSGIRREPWEVLLETSLDQVPYGWGSPALIPDGEAVDPLVDLPLYLLRLVARRSSGSIRKVTDEKSSAQAFKRVVQREALASCFCEPERQSRSLRHP